MKRGPQGRLHTSRCSAAEHHRSTRLGVLCWTRLFWYGLPPRLRYLVAILGAFLGGGFATAIVWYVIQLAGM